MSGRDQDQQRMEVAPTAVEWAIRIASVALMAVVAGYLVVQSIGPDRPPTFAAEAELAGVRHHDSGYELPVRVRNEGTSSVAELTVHVALRDGEATVEEESIVVPFLGHGEEQVIVAWFDTDPRRHEVEVGVGSYARR